VARHPFELHDGQRSAHLGRGERALPRQSVDVLRLWREQREQAALGLVLREQLAHFELLRHALQQPRPVEQIAGALHSTALRRFAVTQVLLAAFMDRSFDAGEVAHVDRLAKASGIGAAELGALEGEVEEFYRRNLAALRALRLAEEPEGLSPALSTRLEALVLANLDRVAQEIRETGELAELLAKAASGGQLDGVEKAKIREQLIDLAKTIPALAIFDAPGGALLLPILIKLLPFSLLPSSFVDRHEPPRGLPERRRKSGP